MENKDKSTHLRPFKIPYYKNELCLDTSNGETIASSKLKELKYNQHEQDIFKQWEKVLAEATKTNEYQNNYSYGVYQIEEELNTTYKQKTQNGKEITVYNYPTLNGELNSLKHMLKEYYLTEIVGNLFKYEFLK